MTEITTTDHAPIVLTSKGQQPMVRASLHSVFSGLRETATHETGPHEDLCNAIKAMAPIIASDGRLMVNASWLSKHLSESYNIKIKLTGLRFSKLASLPKKRIAQMQGKNLVQARYHAVDELIKRKAELVIIGKEIYIFMSR